MQDTLDLRKLKRLDGHSFVYLASPYTKYAGGLEAAFWEACRAAGWLIKRGVHVYCPIAHTHPIAVYSGMDEADHDIWMPADKPFMRVAAGLIVCMMSGWTESYGVKVEIDEFTEEGKPIWFMRWPRK